MTTYDPPATEQRATIERELTKLRSVHFDLSLNAAMLESQKHAKDAQEKVGIALFNTRVSIQVLTQMLADLPAEESTNGHQ